MHFPSLPSREVDSLRSVHLLFFRMYFGETFGEQYDTQNLRPLGEHISDDLTHFDVGFMRPKTYNHPKPVATKKRVSECS